jgi:hydroxymethylbilane synthase
VGQGAIAVEGREADEQVLSLLRSIDDARAHSALKAERAFLARLGSGCDLPVGAYAHTEESGELEIEGLMASVDGQVLIRRLRRGATDSAAVVGASLAEEILLTFEEAKPPL